MSLLGIQPASVQDRSFPSVRRPLDSTSVERGAAGIALPESSDLAPGVRIDPAQSITATSLDQQFAAMSQEPAAASQTYSNQRVADLSQQTGADGQPLALWPSIWPPIWPPQFLPVERGQLELRPAGFSSTPASRRRTKP